MKNPRVTQAEHSLKRRPLAVRPGRRTLREQRGCWAALMRINIWIILATLLALLVITRYLEQGRDTQRICADDPSASVCQR